MFINALTSLLPQLFLSEVNGFTIDSRLVENGDIYLPIKGENVDGHDFIPQAISNGASFIFSEQSSTEILAEVVYVESTLDTLKELAIAYGNQIECPIIGITGSNGKTTTKELLNHVLSTHKKTMCTAGNYNSIIGLPISMFTIEGDEDFCILEMGASEPNEIAELCRIAKPTMGLITNISASHTENFGSLKSVAKTKSDLFTSLPRNGTAFVNIDDNYISTFSTHVKRVTYGFNSDADFNGNFEDGALKINDAEISLPYPSEIMAKNVLATFSIANTIGISHNEIENSINTFEIPTGRSDIIIHNGITIIDDTYNSNLESAKAGIDTLSKYDGNQKIAIIGDMFELGELAQGHHYELGKYISNSNIDILLATGELTQLTVDAARKVDATFFQNKGALINRLIKIANSGDVVYVKGSRGMKMETIIEKGLLK
jgi:UDP-N-acetylmuramoyl-tripeptide--D-alanyl-D-alanine ligase